MTVRSCLKATPKPYTGNEPGLVALWPMAAESPTDCLSTHTFSTTWVGLPECDTLTAPWGPAVPRLSGGAHLAVDDHPALHSQEFTFEAWVAFEETPTGRQTLAELAGEHGISWWLGLNRHLDLEFLWRDDHGEAQRVWSIQMVDLLRPDAWLHVAVAFRNHCYTRQPYIRDYSRVHLYCTPAGELFPRIAGRSRAFEGPQVTEEPADLSIGSDHDGACPWTGAIAQVALTSRAKLANEFPALGQRPPSAIEVSDSFVAGSAFCPVERGLHDVVVGCKPYAGSGNYWFYGRVDGAESQTGESFDFEILPVPGGAGMLMSMFVSYDQRHWQRLPDGHYFCDRGSPLPGSYSFSHAFERFPAWLCTYVPYTADDIDALEQDLSSSPYVEVLTPSRSVDGRPIRLFKITDPSVPDEQKRTIYIQAGQHSPAEMTPGRAIDQAARYLAGRDIAIGSGVLPPNQPSVGDSAPPGDTPDIPELLRTTVFLLVPIVNVDCCHYGGSGMNLNRINTNRDWLDGTQPEVAGLKSFLDDWIAGGRTLDLALDFHAGGAWKNHVVLAIDEDAAAAVRPGWHEEQERFISALESDSGIGREDAHYRTFIEGTFAHALPTQHSTLALCIELSHMTYRDRSGATRAVTQEHLEALGPQLVSASREWLAGA